MNLRADPNISMERRTSFKKSEDILKSEWDREIAIFFRDLLPNLEPKLKDP